MAAPSDSASIKYRVPAVEQAARILMCLAESASSGMSLIKIAEAVNIHRSKVYTILETLQEAGLVQKNAARKGYGLGPGLIVLSRKVLDTFAAPRLSEPILEKLAKETGGTAALGLISGDKSIVVAKHEAGVAINVTLRMGQVFPLTMGSPGKAVAAFYSLEELNALLQSKKAFFYGEFQPMDRSKLALELAECRRCGFALDMGETIPQLNTIAAPVFGPNDAVVGTITLLTLFSVEKVRRLAPSVAAAAQTLSAKLGAHRYPAALADRQA